MSAKPRKASGSFVNDMSSINLIQLSPRNELYQTERGPYTITSHNSKTNFIGDSVLSDGPRAVSVSETGEKHRLPLEEENVLTATTNPFSAPPSPQCSQILEPNPPLQNILSSANLNAESNNQNRLITTKRSKGCRRHGNQKTRPIFTPRGLSPRFYNAQLKPKNQMQNAQTQTEIKCKNLAVSSSGNRHHYTMGSPTCSQLPTLQISRRYLSGRECGGGGNVLDSNTRLQSLRVLGHDKRPMNSLSGMRNPRLRTNVDSDSDNLFKTHLSGLELRNIASAVTLITVVSWLFSLFFELESIVDIFTSPLHLLQNWYAKKEQPMTKMETFVQFMRDLWS